ncbi:unnamed protein product [Dicrocoelium dendriticum]|nr:unnamed protein product [Dicrocoelium dendriticum]
MVSTQVHRFQRRIADLQTHHELSLKRYKTARQNYTSFSRDVLNSLVAHLAETEKNAKNSKRVAKPRASHSQVPKHSRPHYLPCTVPNYSPYGNDPVSNCRDEKFTAYDGLPATMVDQSAKNFSSYACPVNERVCLGSARRDEPVFPPPTFFEHNDCFIPEAHHAQNTCACTDFHQLDNYSSTNLNSTHEFHPNSMYSTSRVYSGHFLPHCSSSTQFDHSYQTPTLAYSMPAWYQNKDSGTTFTLGSCLTEKDMSTSELIAYRSSHSTNDVDDIHPPAVEMLGPSPSALRVFPGLACSSHSRINPILASTYPAFSNHYIDSIYKPLPNLPLQFTQTNSDTLSGSNLGRLSQSADFAYT